MAGRSAADRPIARSGRDDADVRRSTPAADADAPPPTVVERTVYRDDAASGVVDLAIVYEIPESVSKLAFWIERPQVSVVATDGFASSDVGDYTWQGQVEGPAFEWDGTGDRATVVLRQPLDATPATYGAGTDDSALCLRPRTHTRWRYRGTEPQIERAADVQGTGVAGEQFAFLGEHEVAERRVEHETAGCRVEHDPDGFGSDLDASRSGQGTTEGREAPTETLRLVVPDAAELAAGRERVLDSLVAASERLGGGGRNDVVTVFVAPTTGVSWAHRGLSLGPDARVNDTAPIAAPTNIWVHEYVHTRQDREAVTPATEWLLEATAEYYAVTQAFERGEIGFDAYRTVLDRGAGGEHADAILADPATWTGDAQYRKGALVVAALDRRIRAATGGAATFQAVLAEWTRAGPAGFDAAAFADAVESAGGPVARAAAVAYTQRPVTPRSWGALAHATTFDCSPADCGVESSTAERSVDRIAADGVAVAEQGYDLVKSDLARSD
ncbi:hypothetical protein GCM10028857_25140 [Salinarchaeum chitinilyticum]